MTTQTSSLESDRLLTAPEAAKVLRISRSHFYLMLKQKKIPHIRLSERRLVVRENDLKMWLEENSVGRA